METIASKDIKMENGKIYFLSFGGNTEIVGRYKEDDNTGCNFIFYDLLHYWNGFETYRQGSGAYTVKSGISEFRRASKAEIWTLLRFMVEHENI